MDKLRFYYNPQGLNHDTGPGHPESPARLKKLIDLFQYDYPDIACVTTAPSVAIDVLKTIHSPTLIDFLQTSPPLMIDGDTALSEQSWEAALSATSLCAQAARDILDRQTQSAFCAVRPPGHHVEYDKAMGFCLINHAYLAAYHALQHPACNHVTIIDWDVHHGNGTDHLVRHHGREDIDYVSLHEWPLFPGTGGPEDSPHDSVLNIPMPSGARGSDYKDAFETQVIPYLDRRPPDLIILSGGFDAHMDDPLASTALTEDDFEWMTHRLKALNTGICLCLEGGYNLDALERSAACVIDALIA